VRVLFVAWGYTDSVELKPVASGNAVVWTLPLDYAWSAAQSGRAADLENAFIYAIGESFVGIRSEGFQFLAPPGAPASIARAVTVEFPGNQRIEVPEGTTARMSVTVRTRPEPHVLKFVGDDGQPVSDVVVSAYMFWSESNHCGFLAGAEPLV